MQSTEVDVFSTFLDIIIIDRPCLSIIKEKKMYPYRPYHRPYYDYGYDYYYPYHRRWYDDDSYPRRHHHHWHRDRYYDRW
jgi:hypothetical protein